MNNNKHTTIDTGSIASVSLVCLRIARNAFVPQTGDFCHRRQFFPNFKDFSTIVPLLSF